MTERILLYVEDPGAANFVAPLVDTLERQGMQTIRYAAGEAAAMLRARSPDWQKPGGKTAANIIAEGGATALLIGVGESHQSFAHDLVAAARAAEIPSAGLIDSLANAAHRFSGGDTDAPFRHAPDWLLVPDTATVLAFRKLGFPAERVLTVGHPHFDVVRARAARIDNSGAAAMRQRVFPATAPDRKVLTFLSEINDGLDPGGYRRIEDYTLAGRGRRDDRTGIVIEEVLDACADMTPRPWMVLRPHPKNRTEDFAGLDQEFDQIAATEPILDLLAASDLVVGMTAMPLMEAALLGRPVLSVLPRPQEAAWLAITALGLVPIVWKRQEIAHGIRRAVAGSGQPSHNELDAAFPQDASEGAAAAIGKILRGHQPGAAAC